VTFSKGPVADAGALFWVGLFLFWFNSLFCHFAE